jgi:cytochrome c oxidase subunit 2
VKLIMASEKINPKGDDPTDRPVLHSFFIPAFRTKQDVVPGRYTALWFNAEKLGEYQVFCAALERSGRRRIARR